MIPYKNKVKEIVKTWSETRYRVTALANKLYRLESEWNEVNPKGYLVIRIYLDRPIPSFMTKLDHVMVPFQKHHSSGHVVATVFNTGGQYWSMLSAYLKPAIPRVQMTPQQLEREIERSSRYSFGFRSNRRVTIKMQDLPRVDSSYYIGEYGK